MFYRTFLLGGLIVSSLLTSACIKEESSQPVKRESPNRVEFQTINLMRVGLSGSIINQDMPLQIARLSVKYDDKALVDDFLTTMEAHGWQLYVPSQIMQPTILCAGQLEGKKLQTVICTTERLGTVVLAYKMDNLVSTQLDVLFEVDALKILHTLPLPTEPKAKQ